MAPLLSRATGLLLGWALSGLPAGAEAANRAGLDWWAFQEVKRPEVPRGEGVGPIDSFVRERLAKEGLEPASRAEGRTLIRRLYFDLAGVPPTAEEVEAFVEDPSEEAYADLVDRLLGSERFGERWARHWLDVVRYAETNGYERDAVKPNMWKYRDWVIGAFNRDLPYDRFVRAQIAGDEISERSEASVIATGMLRAGTWNDEPNDPQDYKYERLEDMVDVVSTAFLGITVRCARCHDHKFDPIPQRDYYRMAAAFWPGAIEPRDRQLMGGPTEEELGVQGVFGWTDLGRDPAPLHLLVNGDPHRKGEVVEPGHLSLVAALDQPVAAPTDGSRTTQRRLAMAEFITDRRNPLTARVMVNRIWQHLIGQGIVRTPNNFGFKADPPTHPELLDWLAADFMDGGWRMKRVIRQLVMSETYRQASVHAREKEFAERDSGNRLLWKMNRRRADAEAMRDAMLQASGDLSLKMGGPSFYPVMAPEVLEGFSRKSRAWTPSPERERLRRSVYMVSKRHLLLPIMTVFDFPNSEKPCGKRDVTTVAPQALAMLNNHFVHERSERLAAGAMEEAGDLAGAVRLAWRRALGRSPSEEEMAGAREHLARQRDYFAALRKAEEEAAEGSRSDAGMPAEGLALWLEAGRGVSVDRDGRLERWKDVSGKGHDATQSDGARRPAVVEEAIGGEPAIRFSGKRQYLEVAGQVLREQGCTVLAVASDRTEHGGHREIFSNWNGKEGNSVTSLFLGLTGEGTVRFSDDFHSSSRKIEDTGQPFVLAATTGAAGASILHNGTGLAHRSDPLSRRKLGTRYVIGQQGNIDGEYWQGDIAELLVYGRQLSALELARAGRLLAKKYGIAFESEGRRKPRRSPELLALASVCHVLLNSNEFLYVD